MATMSLVSALAASVRKHPQKIALFCDKREYSYAELWDQSLWVAEQLQHRFGVRPGDRVALWLRNCPEFIPALFGILQAGAVAVPINNFLKPDEVGFILNDSGIDTIITDEDLAAN